jgi:hypothetical protein
MAFVLWFYVEDLALAPLPRLVGAVALGVITYAVALLLLWQLAGRPQGTEAALVAAFRQRQQVARGA